MLNQLLKLLLLLLVFVINLPSCWSLCDISLERLHAHQGTCKKLDPCDELAKDVATFAADLAGVASPVVIEAYQVCNQEQTFNNKRCKPWAVLAKKFSGWGALPILAPSLPSFSPFSDTKKYELHTSYTPT